MIDWGLAKDLRADDDADPDLVPSAPLAGVPLHPDSPRSRTAAPDAARDYRPPVPLARVEPNVPPDLAAILSSRRCAF